MKRDRKMTIRFDGAESMTNGRRAAGDEVRMNPQLRVLPDRQAEDELRKSEATAGQERLHRPPVQDDIQELEQLIRQENGTIAQRDGRLPERAGQTGRIEPTNGPRVWTFPEPITPAKTKNAAVEQSPNPAANRTEDAAPPALHPAAPAAKDAAPLATGRTAVIPAAGLASPPLSEADKPYSVSEWELGSLEGAHASDRFGIRPAASDYSRTRSRGPSWLKVFASVAGAIATGALFGYLALALFAGQGPWSGGGGDEGAVVSTTAADPGTSPSASSGSNGNAALPGAVGNGATAPVGADNSNSPDAGNGKGASVPVDLKAQSFQALQYGVFSSAEGADTAVSDLAERGLAAYRWDTASDFRVYVGISGDRDGALALSQLLDGMDVYVKAIELPAVQTMPFSGEADLLQKYWRETGELIGELDRLTLDQLALQSPKPLGADVAASWKKLHEQWLSTSAAIASKLTNEEDKKASDQLAKSINTAAVSLVEFDKKPSTAHLWNAQSALMAAVFAEKGWLESSAGRL